MKFDFALWTRIAVQQLIKYLYGIYMPIRTVGEYLNPDKYLNCDLKVCVHSGTPARTMEQLKKKAISHLRKLQKLPGRVKNYFKHPKISYAA